MDHRKIRANLEPMPWPADRDRESLAVAFRGVNKGKSQLLSLREKTSFQQPAMRNEGDLEKEVIDLPKSFCCSVTGKVLCNPVVHPSGESMEKAVALPQDPLVYYPNRALKSLIEEKLKKANKGLTSSTTSTLPDAYHCPITCDLFFEPVIAPDGTTYEREAIVKWIEEHGTSPTSRESLSGFHLYDNNAVMGALLEETEGDESDLHPSILRWRQEFAARQVQVVPPAAVESGEVELLVPPSDIVSHQVELVSPQERRSLLNFRTLVVIPVSLLVGLKMLLFLVEHRHLCVGPTQRPTSGHSPGPSPGPQPGPTPWPIPLPIPGPKATPPPSPGATPGPTPGPVPAPTPKPTPGPTAWPTPGPIPADANVACESEFVRCTVGRECCGSLECTMGDWAVTTDSHCLSERSRQLNALEDHEKLWMLKNFYNKQVSSEKQKTTAQLQALLDKHSRMFARLVKKVEDRYGAKMLLPGEEQQDREL